MIMNGGHAAGTNAANAVGSIIVQRPDPGR